MRILHLNIKYITCIYKIIYKYYYWIPLENWKWELKTWKHHYIPFEIPGIQSAIACNRLFPPYEYRLVLSVTRNAKYDLMVILSYIASRFIIESHCNRMYSFNDLIKRKWKHRKQNFCFICSNARRWDSENICDYTRQRGRKKR